LFVVKKSNDPSEEHEYDYYVIRGQKQYISRKLGDLNTKYPHLYVLLNEVIAPNAINVFNRSSTI